MESIKEFAMDLMSKRALGALIRRYQRLGQIVKLSWQDRFVERALRGLGCLAENVFHPLPLCRYISLRTTELRIISICRRVSRRAREENIRQTWNRMRGWVPSTLLRCASNISRVLAVGWSSLARKMENTKEAWSRPGRRRIFLDNMSSIWILTIRRGARARHQAQHRWWNERVWWIPSIMQITVFPWAAARHPWVRAAMIAGAADTPGAIHLKSWRAPGRSALAR